ncbi:hypothetical protein DXB97_04465 [Firmicutes bacterium OM07-11]|nr:hypothetical protein DXB97_04465 [Firmicutes bacterium OM07-11]
MKIELKEIDRDSLKVGDVVGVAREVQCGWRSSFRHRRIYPVEIVKVTPKRTKIVSIQFGEHDKYEKFYELDENAKLENELAEAFETLQDGIYRLGELRRNDRIRSISDEDVLEASKHVKAIMEKYKE